MNKRTKEINYKLRIPMEAYGHYFWTVLAYDKNRHFRVVETSQGNIARFYAKPAPLFTTKNEKRWTRKNSTSDIKECERIIS